MSLTGNVTAGAIGAATPKQGWLGVTSIIVIIALMAVALWAFHAWSKQK